MPDNASAPGDVAIKLYNDADGRLGRIEVFGVGPNAAQRFGVLDRAASGFSIRRGANGAFGAVALQISPQQAARDHPAEPVPLHIRNAPTRLMKEIGYGDGYRYDHAEGGHAAGQHYLPDALRGARWYDPADTGFEKTLAERVQWWRKRRGETE